MASNFSDNIYIFISSVQKRTLIILHTQIKYMFWFLYYTLNCIINIISAYIYSYVDNFMRITFTWTLIIEHVFMVFIDNFERSKDRILSKYNMCRLQVYRRGIGFHEIDLAYWLMFHSLRAKQFNNICSSKCFIQ